MRQALRYRGDPLFAGPVGKFDILAGLRANINVEFYCDDDWLEYEDDNGDPYPNLQIGEDAYWDSINKAWVGPMRFKICEDNPAFAAFTMPPYGNIPDRIVFCESYLKGVDPSKQLKALVGNEIETGTSLDQTRAEILSESFTHEMLHTSILGTCMM